MTDKNSAHFIHRLCHATVCDPLLQRCIPNQASFALAYDGGHESNKQRMAMTEKEERLARDRAEIAARVASFKETQQKFEREREQFYETTLANALNSSGRPTFWR